MKNKIILALVLSSALVGCKNDTEVNPKSNLPLNDAAGNLICYPCKVPVNARIAANSGNFVTISDGNWDDASTWQNGLIPTTASSGTINVKHKVTYNGDASAYEFNGTIGVFSPGWIDFKNTSSVSLNGSMTIYYGANVKTDGHFSLSKGTLTVHTAFGPYTAGRLYAQGQINIVSSTVDIQGQLETPNDWNIIDGSNVQVTATAEVKIGDDLKIGDPTIAGDGSQLTNFVQKSCSPSNFSVGDAIFLANPQVRIGGDGVITLGVNSPNGDNDVATYDALYPQPATTPRVYGKTGTNFAGQITSSVVLATKDPSNTEAPYCPTPLPVTLISWSAKYEAPNQVKFDWETSQESKNAGFEIYEVKPCQPLSTAKRMASVPAGTSPYTFSTTYNEGGQYYYYLKQIDTDGTSEKFRWVSVNVGTPSDIKK